METFWFFRLRFRRAYDSTYDSDFRFSPGHKLSYDSDYDSDSDSVASENQPLVVTFGIKANFEKENLWKSIYLRFPGSLKPSFSICYVLFSSQEKYCGALLLFHLRVLSVFQFLQALTPAFTFTLKLLDYNIVWTSSNQRSGVRSVVPVKIRVRCWTH